MVESVPRSCWHSDNISQISSSQTEVLQWPAASAGRITLIDR